LSRLSERCTTRLDSARAHLLSPWTCSTASAISSERPASTGTSHGSPQPRAAAQGRNQEALDHALRDLELCRAAGNSGAEANALGNVGWFHARLGAYRTALAYCQQALNLQRQAEDRYTMAHTVDSLGYIYRHLGDRDQASTCCRHALDLFRQAGDLYSEATCLTYLGDTHRDAGDLDAAHQAWLQAEAILHRLNHPDVERVRRKSRSHTG
jgi:tetratricopeptide (TPR) repeat protein